MSRAQTKGRMVATAARLLQQRGYAATSWRQLVEEAGTPWGSTYHHFPGGKEELAVAAIELSSEQVARFIDRCFDHSEHPAQAIGAWFAGAAASLDKSGYRDGCPVATVALETVPESPSITAAVRTAFGLWSERVTERLTQAGVAQPRAQELATIILINLEGGLVIARVAGNAHPLELAGSEMERLLRAG